MRPRDPTRRAILARLALAKARGRTRPAVRHDPARDLQAPEGAGARRPDRARPRRPAPALPAGGGAAARGARSGSPTTANSGISGLIGWAYWRDARKERSLPANASDALRPGPRLHAETPFQRAAEQVFRAFVEPDRMRHWWAPRGFTMLSCTLDLREGGAWRMTIRSDDTGTVRPRSASIARSARPSACPSPTPGCAPTAA